MRLRLWFVPLLAVAVGCSTSKNNFETRPFFQHEYAVEAHGRKTLFDRMVELDPGTFDVKVAPDYLKNAPARVAVLPFSDVGSANLTVDKIPMTFRSKDSRMNWAWTDAQRLRRPMLGYLAEREFTVVNLSGIDAVLRDRGIDTPAKLYQVPPQELGKWFDADAVVYGTVKTYEAYYFGLLAGWRVGVEIKMVSTRNGETLVDATGSRYDTSLLVALTPVDIAISSATNLLQLRDINLARSEEETCREIVHRIPISDELVRHSEQAALEYAEDPVHQEDPAHKEDPAHQANASGPRANPGGD